MLLWYIFKVAEHSMGVVIHFFWPEVFFFFFIEKKHFNTLQNNNKSSLEAMTQICPFVPFALFFFLQKMCRKTNVDTR